MEASCRGLDCRFKAAGGEGGERVGLERARVEAREKMVCPVGGRSGKGACMGVPERERWGGA